MQIRYYANPVWGAIHGEEAKEKQVVYLVYNGIFVGGFSYKSFVDKIWDERDTKWDSEYVEENLNTWCWVNNDAR